MDNMDDAVSSALESLSKVALKVKEDRDVLMAPMVKIRQVVDEAEAHFNADKPV